MSMKKQFNEKETTILLDLCQWIIKNEYSRTSMLMILSTILRNLAINNGENIDTSFRSTSGLNYQVSVMMRFLSNQPQDSNAPRIFVSVYDERQKHADVFQNDLWAALYMANNDIFKQDFLKYLTSKKPAITSDIYWAMEKAEEYAYSHKMTDKSFYYLDVKHIEFVENQLLSDKTFVSKNKKIIFYIKQGFTILKEYATVEGEKNHSIAPSTTKSLGTKDTATGNSMHIKHTPLDDLKVTKKPIKEFDILIITFSNDIITDDSVPVSFIYYNRKIDNLVSWADLYVRFMRIFWIEQNRHLKKYMGKSLVNQQIIDLGDLMTSKSMAAPKRIADNVFLETKLINRGIVKRIKAVLDISGVPTKRLTITYSQPKTVYEKTACNNFTEWLTNVSGLANATAKSYYSSVKTSERIAREQNLRSQRLLSAESYEEASKSFKELLNCEVFIKMNASAHNSLTAGVRKLLQYFQSNYNLNSNIENQTEKSGFNKNFIQKCSDILREYFQNGFKKGATIASRKFKKYYLDVYGEDFPENIEPEEIIRTIAIEYADKYYLISDEAIKYLRATVNEHIGQGLQIFFYSVLYAKYIAELTEFSIYSDTMLKTVLESIFPNFNYKKNYFSPIRDMNTEKAMVSAYGEEVLLTFDELKDRLPFVDSEQFTMIWSRDSQFVKVSDGRYALANRIHISDTDVKLSQEILREDIANQGYSFLTRLIVEDSEEHNPEISESAMQTVLFDRYLSKEYSRNRYLIAPHDEAISIMTVLMNYCRDCSRITLDEIEQYEYKLTGDENSRRSLKAAVSSMVRIDDTTFVNSVTFDINATDEAIALFMNSKVISLNSITSFNSFPNVDGYVWNSFLLESYLMHYSVRWSFIGENYKKKSIGAVFDKTINCDSYDDVIARAVADSGIELSQNEVCAYLMKEKFRLRKGDFNEIITKAHKIRLQEE